MCNTWTNFINNCLYNAPHWLQFLVGWRHVPWSITGVIIILYWAHITQLGRHYNPSYLSLGWVAGRGKNDPLSHAIRDYRFWAAVIHSSVTLYVGIFFYYYTPNRVIEKLGGKFVGNLAPIGITLLKDYVILLHSWGWILLITGILSAFIIFLDPYGFRKFYLTLLENKVEPNKPAVTFDGGEWVLRERKEVKAGVIFVKGDGTEFRLKRKGDADKDGENWIKLTFNADNKTLSGYCNQPDSANNSENNSESCKLFISEGTEEQKQKIKSGSIVCIGKDDSYVRCEFEV